MRKVGVLLAVLGLGISYGERARAEDDVPSDLPRLIFDTARVEPARPDPEAYRFLAHGEYQLRFQAQRSFPMVATATAQTATPGLLENSLGQNASLSHWLRVTPRLQLREAVELVGQLDVVTGMIVGDKAQGVHADTTPRDDYNGFSNVQPRWLYVQYKLPFGVIRVGQQPNHWGMGIFANDGDHPVLFGDYRYGAISERLLFATKPGGRESAITVAVAGDLVYRDNYARLTRGDQAFQGVLAAFWERGPNRIGLFSTLRHQETDRNSGSAYVTYADELDALAVDLHARAGAPVPGDPDAFVFAEAEAVYVTGSTNLLRTVDQVSAGERTQIRQYGGAAALGYVHRSFGTSFWSASGGEVNARQASAAYLGAPEARGVPYGDIVGQIEFGYASGDADPYDGTQKRFVFDPNHRIGLLLFDEVLRFQTARSATAATDPLLANVERPTPGANLLPSNGGVFGAQYVNPTFIYRPRYWFDLKGGVVLAQSTSDITDPYRLATTGSYVNYRGGDPRKKDLGIELDGGFEARIPLDFGLKAQIGAQAGVLFPGGALEDASGKRLPPQWIAVGRLGMQF